MKIFEIMDLEYLVGIPEQVETFKEKVETLLDEMKNSGQDVHKKYLLSLVKRQQAFLSQFNEIT